MHQDDQVCKSTKKQPWVVPVSKTAVNTFNPIRNVVDTMIIKPNPDIKVIKLTVGDPSIFGNLPPCEKHVEAFSDAVKSYKENGYKLAHGTPEACEAVARYCSTPKYTVNAQDVVLTSGCSGAIEIAIDLLVDYGDNILIPRPGFSLYQCICGSKGIETRPYQLVPEKGWEVDLEGMSSQIDERTKLIVVINPSNPCGSVYTKEHLEAILDVAEKHQIPILCDEVYAYVTFGDRPFYSMGCVTKNVPVLTVGGIAKRFLAPGWRLGWVVIHDRNNAFGEEVRASLRRLCQRVLGPCAPLQAALPIMLSDNQPEFFEKPLTLMRSVSEIFYDSFSSIPELFPVRAYGAMYMLIGINIDKLTGIKDDVEFTQLLMSEQSVFCLPAKCFQYPNFIRVVLTCPVDIAREACARIERFCQDHRKNWLRNGLDENCDHKRRGDVQCNGI
ncbi:tyrosine aminotransferase-like [Dendronephthya gigantea]|uniref:tyrosine aminotransferase-like n=1 Tax=Dendronephthya gigantea TaxID=151771 RepID=UPI00106AA72F|nr:tyrosine aminotransferase-like [Dendronephthya gigantea]